MATVTIRLDPKLLENPDADLRYVVPDSIVACSGGTIRSDGYENDENDVMTLYLDVDDRAQAVRLIRRVLAAETFLDNDLADVARIDEDPDLT